MNSVIKQTVEDVWWQVANQTMYRDIAISVSRRLGFNARDDGRFPVYVERPENENAVFEIFWSVHETIHSPRTS